MALQVMRAIRLPYRGRSGDVDSGSIEAMIDFAQWGAEHFPADKYAFVIWNHG